MKTKHGLVYLVTIFLLSSIFLASCKQNKFPEFSGNQILLYANPSGGISLYNFPTSQRYALTTNKDYFPHLSMDAKTIYFIRVNAKEIKKSVASNPTKPNQIFKEAMNSQIRRLAEIYTYHIPTKKEKKISSIPLYDPGTDPKDFVRFVDQFRKIIVFSNFYPVRMFDVASGKMISDDPNPYFKDCNEISNSQTFFIHVRQIPKKDYIISFDQLEIPQYQDSLFEASMDGTLIEIQKSGKEQILKKSFYGFSFFPEENKLIYSYDHELFVYSQEGDKKLLFPGIHPFCYKISPRNEEYLKFPWFQSSFLIQNEEKVFIGEQNRLSLLDKKKKQLLLFTKDTLQILNSSTDPYYLYDHLDWMSFLKDKSSVLCISSKKIDDGVGPDRIVDLGKSPDLVLLFSLKNDKIVKQFEMNGKKDFTLDIKDIDNDGQNEIINQYSASNFLCEERFQVAGRSLIWIDIFHTKQDGIYEIANQHYPKVYSQLLKKLEPYHQRAITALRLKEPILCNDDLKKLETLIREARIIINTQK